LVKPTSPDDALPPVEVPTMAFVTQLFLIPLLIVSIIVVVWLSVNWLVSVGSDPEKYVKDLQNPGQGSWQSAASLADMLRDPRNDALKRDASLAQKLAATLDSQLEQQETGDHAIKLRIFLCRTLGEFYVTAGLPVLIKAANTERNEKEVVVRRTAIEAIAVLADNTDPDLLLTEPGLLPALKKAARERTTGNEKEEVRGELRARAAFALGVLGGEQALDELEILTGDGYPNARYNAAIGLARNGDVRAADVLIEMLDPDEADVVAGEEEKSAIAWKRALVMINALEAAERLAEISPDAELDELQAAVAKLEKAELDPLIAGRVHTDAREVSRRLEQRSPK
jgi:HEAT repeat protein